MHVALGVTAAVLAGAIQSMGLTLQRKSHLLDGEASPGNGPSPRQSQVAGTSRTLRGCTSVSIGSVSSLSLWRTGVLLFVGANLIGSSVQIVALPLVILCPLQAVGLVFNSIWASVILGEPFAQRSAVGTGLVVSGAALVAGLGAHDEPKRSFEDMCALFGRSPFLLWMTVSLMAVGLLLHRALRGDKHRGVYFGVMSGILSAHSLLMAKVAVGLALQVLQGHIGLIFRWQVWIIVSAFATFAVSQLYYVNRGLQYASTSVLYPLVFCVYNVTSLINGTIFYGLDTVFDPSQVVWVAMGTLFLLCGVMFLSSRLEADSLTSSDPEVPISASERRPLVSRYTSLDSLNPGIANPEQPTLSRPRRVLSKEQTEILAELVTV